MWMLGGMINLTRVMTEQFVSFTNILNKLPTISLTFCVETNVLHIFFFYIYSYSISETNLLYPQRLSNQRVADRKTGKSFGLNDFVTKA